MDGGESGHGKLIALDAVRGIAAFFVFAGHFCEGVTPSVAAALNGTAVYGVLNGPAAVIVFFVLSGFVLALGPLRHGWRALVPLVLKRWPRLAGPVTLASLAYYFAANAGLFPEAARWAGRVSARPLFVFPGVWFDEHHLGDVLHESLITVWLRESSKHNPVLWTMHWEAVGSVLTIVLAAILLARRLPVWLRAGLFAAVWLAAGRLSPWLIPFPAGVLGAVWHRDRGFRTRLGPKLMTPLLVAAAFLLSWDVRAVAGLWVWTGRLDVGTRIDLWAMSETVAAGIVVLSALYVLPWRRVLSGGAGAFAGRISFAFYLMHLLALFTVTAWLYVWWGHAGPVSGPALFIASSLSAVAMSLPVMWFDQWWLRRLASVLPPKFAPRTSGISRPLRY